MNLKTLIVLTALVAAGGGSAFAQATTAGPTPEAKAARANMRLACAADAKTLCPGKAKLELMMCMRGNMAKASRTCQDAAAAAPRRLPAPAQ